MHIEALQFVQRGLAQVQMRSVLPRGTLPRVLEIGARNVNGSVREHVRGVEYVGLDVRGGDGVDVVARGEELPFPDSVFDIALSCGTFEHIAGWRTVFAEMHRVVRHGGRVLVSTVDERWPRHGMDGCIPPPSGEHYTPVHVNQIADVVAHLPVRVCEMTTSPAGDVFAEVLKAPTHVDLGCGHAPKAGFTSLDGNAKHNPDICITVPPLPFDDESVEHVYASHFIEHLTDEDVCRLFWELDRTLRVGGKAEFIVPYGLSHAGIQDPTHKSLWVIEKFLYFTAHFAHLKYDLPRRFKPIRMEMRQRSVIDSEIHVVLEKLGSEEVQCTCPYHVTE